MKKRIVQVLMASMAAAALAAVGQGAASADTGPRLSGQQVQRICFTEFDEHGHVLTICTATLTSQAGQSEPDAQLRGLSLR